VSHSHTQHLCFHITFFTTWLKLLHAAFCLLIRSELSGLAIKYSRYKTR
jgi:hypothetical protein